MTKTNYHIPLQPGGIYHLMSRANGSEKVFLSEENKRYFLQQYLRHTAPVAETFAWILLPNHFHLLVCIKKEADIRSHYEWIKKNTASDSSCYPDFIMERFANWLNGYTKAFNKMYQRKGSLFLDYLRRVAIESDLQLAATLRYIHQNAIHHHCCATLDGWHWSSFREYCSRRYEIVSPDFVRRFFGTVRAFEQYHRQHALIDAASIIE